MRKILLYLALSLGFLGASDLKSCYEMYKIEKENAVNTAVFVLVDETTPFNDSLKEQIFSNALGFSVFSNHIFIAKFSAFIAGKYNETIFSGSLDTPLSDDEKYEINKALLSKVDKCLKDQIGFVKKKVKASIESSFLKQGENIAKSDILYALKDFASSIKEQQAKRKIVILASDMLENSAITSFYAKNAVRRIEAKKELAKVEKEGLFADFDGAEIYVIGTALTQNQKSYVDPKMLGALNEFWNEYFAKSNATLKEFGTPALKKAIK